MSRNVCKGDGEVYGNHKIINTLCKDVVCKESYCKTTEQPCVTFAQKINK